MQGVRRWRGLALLVAAMIPAACTPLPWPGRSPVPAGGERRSLITNECHGLARLTGCSRVQFTWLKGYNDAATPNNLDRVGVLKVGPRSARNVLVLNPGTSAGSAYFLPLAQDVVRRTRGRWQVWSVERRENQLEDHSVLDRAKQGRSTSRRLFDYYLGWLTDPSVTNHFQTIPDSSVSFARGWGMNVEIEDLHRVVKAAREDGRNVVLGGHSLGGSITTAYATWDFHGRPGAKDLSGLVYIDGGSGSTGVTAEQASQSLQTLRTASPWLAFGGIPSPFLGLYSATGSTAAKVYRNERSLGQTFALLPANLKPPVPATNEAQFGYAIDTDTSPSNLLAAQVHGGRLQPSGDPRRWERAGDITPLQRYAAMLSGTGLTGIDGSAWYHPQRLSIDSGAVAAGNANPAQAVLGVKAIHGHDLNRHTLIYAFGAALGGARVLASAQTLAAQSSIPDSNLTLIDRSATYSHNDPSSASPHNDFVDNLIPFLTKDARLHHR